MRWEAPLPVERLAAGQRFHRAVQAAFLSGPVGGQGFRERRWRLVASGHGRVDLAVETNGAEQMLVIIEIKGTSWDAIPAERVRPNLRRHLRQLQGYLNTATEEMDAGQWPGGIAGALLYSARPYRAATAEMIEALAGEQAIMVTWYLEADWGQ